MFMSNFVTLLRESASTEKRRFIPHSSLQTDHLERWRGGGRRRAEPERPQFVEDGGKAGGGGHGVHEDDVAVRRAHGGHARVPDLRGDRERAAGQG